VSEAQYRAALEAADLALNAPGRAECSIQELRIRMSEATRVIRAVLPPKPVTESAGHSCGSHG
jgi:hypothetical protein